MPMDRGSQRSQASNEKLEPDNKIIINKLKKKKKKTRLSYYSMLIHHGRLRIFLKNNSIYLLEKNNLHKLIE